MNAATDPGTLTLGENEILRVEIDGESYQIEPREVRALLFHGRVVPIWLDEELEEEKGWKGGSRKKRDDDTRAPGLPDPGVNDEDVDSCSESENEGEGTERSTSSDTSLHHLSGTHSMDREMGDDASCACVPGCGENKSPAGAFKSLIARSGL